MKIEVNLSKNYILLIVGVFLLFVGVVMVYAIPPTSPKPNPGHDISELQKCPAGSVLKSNSAGNWECVNVPVCSSGTVLTYDGSVFNCVGSSSSIAWVKLGSYAFADLGKAPYRTDPLQGPLRVCQQAGYSTFAGACRSNSSDSQFYEIGATTNVYLIQGTLASGFGRVPDRWFFVCQYSPSSGNVQNYAMTSRDEILCVK